MEGAPVTTSPCALCCPGEAKTRSGTVQSSVAGRDSLRRRPWSRRVRADRFGQRQGALCVPATGPRQDHRPVAGRPGGREDHSPPASSMVCTPAVGAPAVGVSAFAGRISATPRAATSTKRRPKRAVTWLRWRTVHAARAIRLARAARTIRTNFRRRRVLRQLNDRRESPKIILSSRSTPSFASDP